MPTQIEKDLRRKIVEIGRRVYDRFLVAANDGNISVRLDKETVLVTPTGLSKGFMLPEDILKVRLEGQEGQEAGTTYRGEQRATYRTLDVPPRSQTATTRPLVTETDIQAVPSGGRLAVPKGALVTPLARQIALERHVTLEEEGTPSSSSLHVPAAGPRRRPSSETPMHLAIYRARADVRAVVHTHAPAATAFAMTGARLDEPLLPEMVVHLGPVALVPYARAGTEKLPQAMVPYLADHDVFLLANHGAVTVGRTLEEAYFQMERLELFARIRLAASKLGPASPLPPEELAHLAALREHLKEVTWFPLS